LAAGLWLDVALAVMEQGWSLVIQEKPETQGRYYRLAQQIDEMELDSELIDECLRLLNIDAEQSHISSGMEGYTPSTN